MRVKDLMSTRVISAPVGTPVQEAYALMRDGGFRHLPVLSATGKLMGILSDHDLRSVGAVFKNANSGIDEFLVAAPTTVEEIMVANPITVSPDASVSKAVKIIRDKRIGCLIVTDGGEMVGILSYLDVLDAADRESEQAKQKYRDPNDTQPMNKAELAKLRQQMAAELSEFRASDPDPEVKSVDLRAREERLAKQEARRKADEKERADAARRIMDDIRAQLKDDD